MMAYVSIQLYTLITLQGVGCKTQLHHRASSSKGWLVDFQNLVIPKFVPSNGKMPIIRATSLLVCNDSTGGGGGVLAGLVLLR